MGFPEVKVPECNFTNNINGLIFVQIIAFLRRTIGPDEEWIRFVNLESGKVKGQIEISPNELDYENNSVVKKILQANKTSNNTHDQKYTIPSFFHDCPGLRLVIEKYSNGSFRCYKSIDSKLKKYIEDILGLYKNGYLANNQVNLAIQKTEAEWRSSFLNSLDGFIQIIPLRDILTPASTEELKQWGEAFKTGVFDIRSKLNLDPLAIKSVISKYLSVDLAAKIISIESLAIDDSYVLVPFEYDNKEHVAKVCLPSGKIDGGMPERLKGIKTVYELMFYLLGLRFIEAISTIVYACDETNFSSYHDLTINLVDNNLLEKIRHALSIPIPRKLIKKT